MGETPAKINWESATLQASIRCVGKGFPVLLLLFMSNRVRTIVMRHSSNYPINYLTAQPGDLYPNLRSEAFELLTLCEPLAVSLIRLGPLFGPKSSPLRSLHSTECHRVNNAICSANVGKH